MLRVWLFLRSPRLAVSVLSCLALYCGAAAWLPWSASRSVAVPGWAFAFGLDDPFSSPLFLAAVLLLFLSTLACTLARARSVLSTWSGRVRACGVPFSSRPEVDFEAFLQAEGFRRGCRAFFHHRHALWGGLVLHVGLLALIVGVLVQRGFHDGGAFELAEGETAQLSAPGVIFGRDAGPLAASSVPALTVTLLSFDPFLHQGGYAPDRGSRVRVERSDRPPVEAFIDRASGLDLGSVAIYQAIPTSLALTVEIEGLGLRALHLRTREARRASATFVAPGGDGVRFFVASERSLDDRAGTGALRAWVETEAGRAPIQPGAVFRFGGSQARLVSFSRWGGFTYARSPGMPAVLAGFVLLLSGAALMVVPAGVAELGGPDDPVAGWVFVTRGREALLAEWAGCGAPRV